MSDTLKLWDAVKKIDPKYTKQVNDAGKQRFTNIDAYYLIERATETFGSMGKGFGLKELQMDEVHLGDTILVKLQAVFFYPEGEFPVYNAMKLVYKTQKGYDKVDEDAYKKLITNTLSKALSYLGFGADVYMGKFEDAAYVQEVAQEFATEEYYSYLHTIKAYIEKAEHKEKVTAWVLERAGAESIEVIPFESAKEIAKLIEQKQKRAAHDNTGV
ncbi:Phage protein [hydrothermal vent metagenome]|uniref:Phage protein n=1 Tax=hydrothermal vent metagenome TaxID=652676 RepID=A0A1W1E897_9ZZZZ